VLAQLSSKVGVLLINLGTPDSPSITDVRKYLQEFLSDPRVIELPSILRWLLLKLIILPFRSKKSAEAYHAIWQDEGSPLFINSHKIQNNLQMLLGNEYKVVLGMRYGKPNIAQAIDELDREDIQRVAIVPLFPQYASAVSGSALQEVLDVYAKKKVITPFKIICEFFDHPEYIKSLANSVRPYLLDDHEFLLMSYHGLPERQLINPGINCYRTKCLQTSNLLAAALNLPAGQWGVSFQSRLGKLPWIKPYTEEFLLELRARGINNLLVCCPSFVADCLETLEEIGIRAKKQWQQLGGGKFELIPCLNSQPDWISALKTIALH
jgi:ferrochelatase